MGAGGNIPVPGVLYYLIPSGYLIPGGARDLLHWSPGAVEQVPRSARDEVIVNHRPRRGAAIDPASAFEQQMLPHLAAALTLARYLLREMADA